MGVRQTPDVSPGRDRRIRSRLRRTGIGLLASVLVVPGVAVTATMADSPTRVIETTSGPVRGLILLCHKFHLWLLRTRRTQCGHR
jgi:hypothetical protein